MCKTQCSVSSIAKIKKERKKDFFYAFFGIAKKTRDWVIYKEQDYLSQSSSTIFFCDKTFKIYGFIV